MAEWSTSLQLGGTKTINVSRLRGEIEISYDNDGTGSATVRYKARHGRTWITPENNTIIPGEGYTLRAAVSDLEFTGGSGSVRVSAIYAPEA